MNGKTHQITGIATTLAATWLCAANTELLQSHLPAWLSPILTPPAPLQVLGGANTIKLGQLSLDTATGDAISAGQSLGLLAAALVMGIIAGQLPDLDTPDSTISHYGMALSRKVKVKGIPGLLLKIAFWIVNIIPFAISTFANLVFNEHRNGFIHGLVGLFGFSFLFGWLSQAVWNTPFWGFLFFVGYATHLAVDSFSRSGVKWLWPLTDHSFHFMPAKATFYTANPLHNALAQSVAMLLIGWVGYQFCQHLPVSVGETTTTNMLGAGVVAVEAGPPAWVVFILVGVVGLSIAGIIWSGMVAWPEFKARQFRGEV